MTPIVASCKMIKQCHKDLRRELKKLRRKDKRQCQAKADDEKIALQEVVNADDVAQEAERQSAHEQWVEREKQALEEITIQKEKHERELKRQEEQERQIREEWEERTKKEKEEEERRAKEKEERDKKVEKLLKEATINENDDSNATWHNPIHNERLGKEILRECCPFFTKTGACRFNHNCSRAHVYPDTSRVLMFPGMFTSFLLEQGLQDECDTDIGLEYEDSEVQQHFYDFYNDVLPEFKTVGRVTQFKVCSNYEPHLRGNVYVAFEEEDRAKDAYLKFNGRFYGGKCLSAMFVDIASWKSAICGLFGRKLCPKGKNCNFLHVFRNPTNEFSAADRDNFYYENRKNSKRRRHHRSRSRSDDEPRRRHRSRDRQRSRSKSLNHKSVTRRSRTRSRSKSRLENRIQRSRRARRKSRSRSGSPGVANGSNRDRSRSGSRSRGAKSPSKSADTKINERGIPRRLKHKKKSKKSK